MESRLLILNSDPVFQDHALACFDLLEGIEIKVVRSLADAISVLLRENFDAFFVEAATAPAVEQASHVRQHFPSLKVVCLVPDTRNEEAAALAQQQNLKLLPVISDERQLAAELGLIVQTLDRSGIDAAEGIDPCHSLIGNLNQFSAAEILQMSCLGQRSGRFTFKSGRGNSEIYLQHGSVRHAVFDTLEGEAAVAEIFRWRQGRFYFEEGIISQIQSVDRPWAHLLIDNLQKLDETLELARAERIQQ